MMIFVGWLVFSICVGILASNRGRSAIGWVFLSFFISPLLTFVFLVCMKNLTKEKKEEEEKQRRDEESRRHRELMTVMIASNKKD
ncbi:MAG: hypothetical protein ACRDCQ_10360 [Aeromonas sobria]